MPEPQETAEREPQADPDRAPDRRLAHRYHPGIAVEGKQVEREDERDEPEEDFPDPQISRH